MECSRRAIYVRQRAADHASTNVDHWSHARADAESAYYPARASGCPGARAACAEHQDHNSYPAFPDNPFSSIPVTRALRLEFVDIEL
jgi:hypothetical protein